MPPISPPNASQLLLAAFCVVSVLVAYMGVSLVRTARQRLGHEAAVVSRTTWRATAVIVGWTAFWLFFAHTGLLARFDRFPPPAIGMFLSVMVAGFAIATSKVGGWLSNGLPVVALIGLQGFRFPLELVMHQAAREGVMPEPMTFTGRNFDILTGVAAITIALVYRKREVPRTVAVGFSILGTGLLATILVIALASMPLIRAFGDDPKMINTWVFYPPFVLLPVLFVLVALAGQLVLIRRLFFAMPRLD